MSEVTPVRPLIGMLQGPRKECLLMRVISVYACSQSKGVRVVQGIDRPSLEGWSVFVLLN